MKQNLNEQIARIKRLLALNESTVIEETEQLDEQLGEFIKKIVPALERKFISGIEGKLGKKIAQASDAEIGNAFKSAELAVLRKEIAAAVYASEKTMIDDVFSKYNMSVAGDAQAAYRELQSKGLNKSILRDVASEWKAGGKGTSLSASTGSSASASTSAASQQNAALKPNNAPSASTPKSGQLPPDADTIINATAKSSAEAAAYMAQIEALGFNPKITKLLQLEYGKAGMANKTAAEIIDAGNQLARQLSEKEYGWAKRIWASISKDPAASVSKAGKAGTKMIFWYTVLALSLTGAGIAFAIKNKIENKTGTKGSDILPDIPNIPDAQPKKQADADSVDWSKYKPQN